MCTRVNRDLLTSVMTSTAILHRFHSVVDMNCDPSYGYLRYLHYRRVAYLA
jgi:hypothetical protein